MTDDRTPAPRRSTGRRILTVLRDGWLVVGMMLLILVGAELLYRGQGGLRRLVGGWMHPPQARHPYADSAWFAPYQAEQDRRLQLAWAPYVYWRRLPSSGTYISVDSARHRRTVQPAPSGPGQKPVFFFGGSTMYGNGQRDAFTIPSVVVGRLAQAGITDVAVTNFGETGWVFTQEVIALLVELRGGARPSVVVFYDGINDVGGAVQDGTVGIPINEFRRAQEYRLGRTVLTSESDLATEARAGWQIAQLVAGRSAVYHRISNLVHRSAPAGGRNPDSLAAELVRTYASTAGIVEAVSKAYGFQALYVWQPALQATRKPLSAFEHEFVDRQLNEPSWQALRAIHERVPAALAAAMASVAPGRFLDLSGIFAGETATVYLDDIGHTTESAVGPIVDAFLPALTRLLRQSPP